MYDDQKENNFTMKEIYQSENIDNIPKKMYFVIAIL